MAKPRTRAGRRSLRKLLALVVAKGRGAWLKAAERFNSLRENSQGFFHWNYSNGAIFALWTLVPGMVSLGDFGFAYAFAVCALLWTLGFVITADHIRTKNVRTAAALLTITFFSAACMYVHGKKLDKILGSNTGVLLPGTMKTPPNHCGDDVPGSITFILGTMDARTSVFPATIITVHGKPLLTVDRAADGKIVFSADIYDGEDNIVAEIDKGQYDVDSSVFKMKRSGLSNLSVVIRKDKEEVLKVNYINPQAVSITGVFRAHYTKVEVSKDGIMQDGKYLGTLPFCASYTQGKIQSLFAFGRP
jgi:hypothetical protein